MADTQPVNKAYFKQASAWVDCERISGRIFIANPICIVYVPEWTGIENVPFNTGNFRVPLRIY